MSAHSDAHPLLQLASGQTVPPDALQAWAADAVRDMATGQPVDRAVRLSRADRVRMRNRLLMQAAGLVAPGADPWHAAGAVACLIKRYERSTTRRLYLAGVDVTPEDPAEAAVHRAACLGVELIGTQRNLYALIK
jgi:hypothetical protein